MATSPITAVPLEQDPQSNEYQIMLPTRSHDDGTPIVVSYDKSIPMDRAMEDISSAFPRNSADTQVDKMQGGTDYVLNKMTKEDYLEWQKDKSKYDDAYDVSYTDLIVHAAKDFGMGMVDLGIESAKAQFQPDGRRRARAYANAAEGFLIGTERLGMLFQLGWHAGGKLVTPDLSDYGNEASYQAYKKGYELADVADKRSKGALLTEGAKSPVFGSLISDTGLEIQDPAYKASPDDIRAANSISNALDASWLLGGVGFLEKAAALPLINRVASKLVPSAILNEALPKLAFKGMAATGTALDFISRKTMDALGGIVSSVSDGAVSQSAKQVANVTSRSLLYATDIAYGTGGTLVAASLGGKAMRAVGGVGEAVIKGLAEGSVRQALEGLAENTTKAATVRRLALASAKIAPPDTITNAMKHLADAAVNTGALMGGIGAMQSYAMNDDPIHGFMEGFAGGLGVGVLGGLPGFGGEILGSKLNRVSEAFKKDISSRPLEQKISYTSPTGEVAEVAINDLQGRLNLYNHPGLSLDQKHLILGISQAVDKAGNTFIFHDGKNSTTEALDRLGLMGGDAVHIRRQQDGRSIVIVNPMSEGFNPADVLQEFFHSNFSDAVAKDVFTGMMSDLKTEDPNVVIKELYDFSKKYTDLLKKADPEIGGAKADDFLQRLDKATDPTVSLEDKINILSPVIDEYISNFAGAKLAGAKSHDIMPPKIRNLWDKTWDRISSNILSALDFSKQGLSKDPIYGHFFDERGKLAMNPELSSVVNKIVEAAAEGKMSIQPKDTFDGTSYFHVTKDKPFISIEDMVDGEWTKTRAEKQKILGEWFKQAREIASADPGAVEFVQTADMAERGVMHGNVSEGSQVLFSQNLSDDALLAMARIQVNGRRVFTQDQEAALIAVNQAIKQRRVISMDAWHDVGRTQGSRQDRYYGRANRSVLPIAIQQTKTGGLTLNFLDVGRVWNLAKRMSQSFPEVRAELASKDIRSLHDFLPYIQAYFENYSSGSPVSAKNLPGFSETMRDILYNSLNIRNRGERSKYYVSDQNKFKNEPTFRAKMFNRYEEVPIDGNNIRLERNSVSLGSIRMDRILGASDFTRNGDIVHIEFNPQNVAGYVRANFAAKTTLRERLGNSEVVTDQLNGKRIIVSESGKATLFDNDKKVVYGSEQEAIDAANRNSVALAAQFAARKYTSRSKPAPGKETEHADVKKRLELLINQGRQGKIPESQKKETDQEIRFLEARLKDLSKQYHTVGNEASDNGFSEHELIKTIIAEGGILWPHIARDTPGSILAQYDYFNPSGYKTGGANGWLTPIHRSKVFSNNGKSPDAVLNSLIQNSIHAEEGSTTSYATFLKEGAKPEDLFQLIENISNSARKRQLTGSVQEIIGDTLEAVYGAITTGRGKEVPLTNIKVGDEFKIGSQYIVRANKIGNIKAQHTGEFEGVRFGIYNGSDTANHEAGKGLIEHLDMPYEEGSIWLPTGKKEPKKAAAKKEAKTGPEAMPAAVSETATSPLRGREDMFGEEVPVIPPVDPYAVVIEKGQHIKTTTESALEHIQNLNEINAKFELESEKIRQELGEIDLSLIRGTETKGKFQLGNEPKQMIGGRSTAPDVTEVKPGAKVDPVREFKAKELKRIEELKKEVAEEIKDTQQLINLYVDPAPQLPFEQAKEQARERVERLYIDNPQVTHRERAALLVKLRNERVITPDQVRMTNEMLRGKHGATTYESQITQAGDYLLGAIDGTDAYHVPPAQPVDSAVKFTPDEAKAFLESHKEFVSSQAEEKDQYIQDKKEADRILKEKKKELTKKPISEMTKEEISLLSSRELDRKLEAAKRISKAEYEKEKLRTTLYVIEDLAARIRKRGGTGDKKLDAKLNPGYIKNIESLTEALELGNKLSEISVSRFDDYMQSKVAQANEVQPDTEAPKEKTKSIAGSSYDPASGMSYADYLLKKKEIKDAQVAALKRGGYPIPPDLQTVWRSITSKHPLEKEVGPRTQASMFEEPAAKPAFNLDNWRFGMEPRPDRFVAKPVSELPVNVEPVAANTEVLVKNNPVAIKAEEVPAAIEPKAPQAKVEAPKFNMDEWGFSKGEKPESKPVAKEEPKAAVEKKADPVAVKAIKEEPTQHKISPGFSSKKGTEVNDPAMPKGVKIIFTPSKNYRVIAGTGAALGIARRYDEAFKIAAKNSKRER